MPGYAVLVAVLATLAGGDGRGEETGSLLLGAATLVGMLGFMHVLFSSLELRAGQPDGRRTQAILRRAVRNGRHTWCAADGWVVRVYTLVPERDAKRAGRRRGRRPVEVKGAVEFDAEDQADEAHAHVAEVEQAHRPNPSAIALTRVLNERNLGPCAPDARGPRAGGAESVAWAARSPSSESHSSPAS